MEEKGNWLFAELGTTQIKNHFHEKSTLPDKGPVGPLSPMETFTPLRKTMTAHKLKGLIWPECIMNISFGLKTILELFIKENWKHSSWEERI